MFFINTILLGLTATVAALPSLKRTTTALSSQDFDAFTPFTQFARAAYCPTAKIMNWSCGGAYLAMLRERSKS
jgi:hypothetical protein